MQRLDGLERPSYITIDRTMVDADSTPEHAPQNYWPVAALLLIVLLGAWIRGLHLNEGLWLDELHTSWTIAEGPGEIQARAAAGNYSPLYFYLVWASAAVWGESEWSLRLPSFLAGLATIVAAYAIVLRWTQSALLALLAATLVTLDSTAIWYSAEARPYALVQLGALGAMWLFGEMVESPTAFGRAALVLLAALLFYLHFTTALLALGALAYYVVRRVQRGEWPDYCPRLAALDGTVMLFVCLPAAGQVWEIAGRREAWAMFLQRPTPIDLAYGLPTLCYLVMPWVFVWVVQWLPIGQVSPQVIAPEEERQAAEATQATNHELWLAWCWIALPMVATWAVASSDLARLFSTRYLVGAVIAMPLIAALVAVRGRAGIDRYVVAAALVFWSLGIGTIPNDRLPREPTFVACWQSGARATPRVGEQWREAIADLQASPGFEDLPLLVRSGLIEADRLQTERTGELVEYCLLPVHGLYRVGPAARPVVPLETTYPGRVRNEDVRQMIERGGAWLLIAGRSETGSIAAFDILDAIGRAGGTGRIEYYYDVDGVSLLRISARPR